MECPIVGNEVPDVMKLRRDGAGSSGEPKYEAPVMGS